MSFLNIEKTQVENFFYGRQVKLSYEVNIIATADLVAQGAKISAAMVVI